MTTSTKLALSAALPLLLLSAPLAHAQTVIISDDFSTPNVDSGSHTPYNIFGTNIAGLAPANGSTEGNLVAGTDLSGGKWLRVGGGGDSDTQEVGAPGPAGTPGTLTLTGGSTDVSYASILHGGDAAITLGGYNDSTILTIQAAISPVSVFGEVGSAYLGFKTSSLNGDSDFSGLILDSTGGLNLILSGVVQPDAVAYTGATFNDMTATMLTFTVNTTTGALTSISLQGSTANYSSLLGGTTFTNGQTSYAAMDSPGGQGGRYADFSVSSVPEPSTYALLSFGGLLLFCLHRRQRVRV